jgi:hypothetical protein
MLNSGPDELDLERPITCHIIITPALSRAVCLKDKSETFPSLRIWSTGDSPDVVMFAQRLVAAKLMKEPHITWLICHHIVNSRTTPWLARFNMCHYYRCPIENAMALFITISYTIYLKTHSTTQVARYGPEIGSMIPESEAMFDVSLLAVCCLTKCGAHFACTPTTLVRTSSR